MRASEVGCARAAVPASERAAVSIQIDRVCLVARVMACILMAFRFLLVELTNTVSDRPDDLVCPRDGAAAGDRATIARAPR